MRTLYTILIFSTIILELKGADTTAYRYFPMSTGNIYVYQIVSSGSGTYKIKAMITKDSVFNNHKYFYLTNFNLFNNGWYRSDTITGSLYKYSTTGGCIWNNDLQIDSLAIPQGNWNTCQGSFGITIAPFTLFGVQSTQIHFERYIGSYGNRKKYVKDIGFYVYVSWAMGSGSSTTLIGCVLNGISYGDTSFPLGINQLSGNIPTEYSLSQNYPNPFNPSTKLKFQMPNSGFAVLKVFDALGREVQVLVNQKLSPGTYEVDFDGSNLPSGVYYYRLDASAPLSLTYSETKKMVLIK
jgi:Secretion system C-terminal sorting domain